MTSPPAQNNIMGFVPALNGRRPHTKGDAMTYDHKGVYDKEETMSHTPGPWTVGQYTHELDDDGELVPILGIYGHDGLKVAKIETWRGKEYADEWEGNAAIIAASLEMKESLHELLAYIGARDTDVHGNVLPIIDKVRRVLTKAEGRILS
jgi:hypothetical protein